MARGAGGGGGGDYFKYSVKGGGGGGDYSRDGYYSRKYGIQTGNFSIHLYRPNRS